MTTGRTLDQWTDVGKRHISDASIKHRHTMRCVQSATRNRQERQHRAQQSLPRTPLLTDMCLPLHRPAQLASFWISAHFGTHFIDIR